VFLGALVFGAIAAVAVAWLSDFVHEEMNEVSSLLQDPLIRPAIDATV
jgi:fructose-specific phosphotransferase system IIC component